MNAKHLQLMAMFDDRRVLTGAVRSLLAGGVAHITVLSPMRCPEIEQQLGGLKSPVRFFTLTGALVGAAVGLSLTIGAALEFSLITGGKPIISVPPFLVITFELTILFAALATIAGLFWKIHRPGFTVESYYDPQFSVDRFGIRVLCGETEGEAVSKMLVSAGALEVRNEEV